MRCTSCGRVLIMRARSALLVLVLTRRFNSNTLAATLAGTSTNASPSADGRESPGGRQSKIKRRHQGIFAPFPTPPPGLSSRHCLWDIRKEYRPAGFVMLKITGYRILIK